MFKRLFVLVLLIAASVTVSAPSQAAGCEPIAYVPIYNSYTNGVKGKAYLPCSGYFEVSLMTSSGALLGKWSGNHVTPLYIYSHVVNCPTGTHVYTHAYEKVNVQGNTYTYRVTSAPFLCPQPTPTPQPTVGPQPTAAPQPTPTREPIPRCPPDCQ